jgi:chromosome segregation ATPase
MKPNPELTAKFEEERVRAHDQSQVVYLQGQVDELRRLIKDQTNKYNWAVEQTRKTEAAVAQVQAMFERHTDEIRQTVEIARRDIVGLRKEISGALVKIEDGVRPLREMQSQIHQLGEARKQDRDAVTPLFARIEETEQKHLGVQAQVREVDDRYRQLVGQLERLREADGVALLEVRRVGEELQIEKQSLRRQVVEAQQLVTDVRSLIDDHEARIKRLDEIRQHIDTLAESLPGQIVAVAEKLPDMVADTKRIERISTERFLMNQERLEDLRRQADERLNVLQDTDEQHLRQVTAWLERIDGWVRELEGRITRNVARLEAAQQIHVAHITDLERREMRVLDAFTDAFRAQAVQTKQEQVETREHEERRGS